MSKRTLTLRFLRMFREFRAIEEDAEMANGCLMMIADDLEHIGCGCAMPETRYATPPMMYNDWIRHTVWYQRKLAHEEGFAAGVASTVKP